MPTIDPQPLLPFPEELPSDPDRTEAHDRATLAHVLMRDADAAHVAGHHNAAHALALHAHSQLVKALANLELAYRRNRYHMSFTTLDPRRHTS